MILKNLSRAAKPGAEKSLVSYVLRYAANPDKQIDKKNHFVLTHNLRGKTIDEFAKQYEANQANRLHKSIRQTAIHHTILAFNHEDSKVITDDMLRSIANRFIQLRGEENLFLFAKHENTDSLHMHCCVSGSTISGKASRLSNKEFASIKKELDFFQQIHFPQLSSLPRHGLAKQIALAELKKSLEITMTDIEQDHRNRKTIEETVKITILQEESVEKQVPIQSPYFRTGRFTDLSLEENNYRLSRIGFNEEIQEQVYEAKNLQETAELKELQAIREQSREMDRDIEHVRNLEDLESLLPMEATEVPEDEFSFESESELENEG